jgi:sulfide dehydrogenase cytochrome subunit
MVRWLRVLWIVELAVAWPAGGAMADDSLGVHIAATCAACHRLDGRDQAAPPIVGLSTEIFLAKMQAFRVAERPNHIMHAVSISLSDSELAAVARYLAGLQKEAKAP